MQNAHRRENQTSKTAANTESVRDMVHSNRRLTDLLMANYVGSKLGQQLEDSDILYNYILYYDIF